MVAMNRARGLLRGLHTSTPRLLKTVEEVKIPVPWGHIAGKWWGPRNIEPVLALHGWLDNASSWDPICEALPEEEQVSVLALDLPGNGASSHLPPFQNYSHFDGVGFIRRIRNTLVLSSPLKLLGHSAGSAVCFYYSALYPEDVHSYFGVDYATMCYVDEEKRTGQIGKLIDEKIELFTRENVGSRKYTWEEARDVWIKTTNNSLDIKSCETLMRRGVTTLPDGKVYFSRDQRVESRALSVYNSEQVRKFAENIQCHVHIVKALRSPLLGQCLKYTPDLIDIIKKNSKSFEYTEIDGKHHFHMDVPEKFVPLVLNQTKKT